jgi:transposase
MEELEDRLGFRILMTNRHDWDSSRIVEAYYGQSKVEHAFRDIKNPYHLAVRPQHHWTDQKIKVHFFTCVIGYLLTTLVWREARLKAGYKKSLDSLIEMLNNIRLGTVIEKSGKKGRPKANYLLEDMDDEETSILEALEIQNYHTERPEIRGVGVYSE